jgi:glycosyltransferase involved in cell wall biosynthesis
MNVLVVNYEYPPIGGGGGVICKDISEEIASKGHRVTVVTSHYDSLPLQEYSNGVTIIRLPVVMRGKKDVASILSMISYVPLCIRKAASLLRRERYDVIHTHFAIPSGPAGQYISDKYGIPNVLSIHGGDIFDPSKSLSPHDTIGLRQTVRKMLRMADRVVAQSSDTKSNAEEVLRGRSEDRHRPSRHRPNAFHESRQDLGLPRTKYVFPRSAAGQKKEHRGSASYHQGDTDLHPIGFADHRGRTGEGFH